MKIPAMIFVVLSSALANAGAAELDRLFYTPQQRAQLEAQQTSDGHVEGGKRNFIVVNGVIQRHGGKRIVWINGAQQPAESGNDKAPAIVPVTVPGKSQPVQAKVGQHIMLDQTAPEEK